MKLLAKRVIWQKTAQNGIRSTRGFFLRPLWRTVHDMADASSKASACTNQYRYPSPFKRFGSFGSGPLFFGQHPASFKQRTAENRANTVGDSFASNALLYVPTIKTIRGTNQCKSNTWPLLPYLSHRLQPVWTMTLSAPQPGLLEVPLSSGPWGAVCLPVRLSGRVLARFATMSACASEVTQKIRTRVRSQIITFQKTTAGPALRWFFCDVRTAPEMGRIA